MTWHIDIIQQCSTLHSKYSIKYWKNQSETTHIVKGAARLGRREQVVLWCSYFPREGWLLSTIDCINKPIICSPWKQGYSFFCKARHHISKSSRHSAPLYDSEQMGVAVKLLTAYLWYSCLTLMRQGFFLSSFVHFEKRLHTKLGTTLDPCAVADETLLRYPPISKGF